MKLTKQIATIVLIVAVFAAFNLSMYQLLTRRLSNNFSDATQAQMIDVRSYLPHKKGSDLPKIHSSLKLTDNLPVLDGAAALVPVYAAVIDNVYPNGCVTYDGGEFSDDNYYGENFAEDSAMQYNNTVRGYQAIVDGTTDILFCAAPSDAQKQYAEEKGVELVYVPVGLEGFVFFVNENNPVDNLTVEQIRKIYACEYTNWSEVGGANRIINPVTRLEGSGSQTTFELFMGDYKLGRKSLLAITGASIGFSFRYYMDGIVQNDSVKMLSLNGVYPNTENIKNRSYPIVAQFYAIYRADNDNENIPALIDWLLSEEGQTLIEETGYVRIN
ncbi:MAG: phosphate ABC transporter substrate-binding protein, PhoT family [Ruminococcaceae bacterium]|nr:phosphate ABC transporter substrate-binding protein, PhoT family [Oscillospiraceae bacterium]